MKKITQLIKSMSPHEARLLKKYYALGAKKEVNLKIKLFDLVRKGGNLSDREAAESLDKKNDASFSMLKSRLQSDILRILLWEHEVGMVTSKYYKARFLVRLLLLEIEIVSWRGMPELAEEKINRAKAIASKYELAHEIILLNDLIADRLKTKRGPQLIKKLKDSTEVEIERLKDQLDAEEYFRILISPGAFMVNKKQKYIEQARIAGLELQKLTVKNNSAKVRMLFLRSQAYYFHLLHNYTESEKYGLEFLQLAKTNRILRSNDHITGAYMQLSTINLHIGNYNKTIEYAQNGMEYSKKGYRNLTNLHELVLLSYIYKGEPERALSIFPVVRSYSVVKPGTPFYFKWIYYEANLNFKLKKYKETISLLKRHSTLTADKSGWRLGFKMLEILTIIEMQQFDWLEYRLEAFRKLLATIRKENIERPKIAYQVIKMLVKYNFDYAAVTDKMQEQLALFKSENDPYRWDPHGYEIIRFDWWWEEKLAGKKMKAIS